MKKRVIVCLIAMYLLAGLGSAALAQEKEAEEKPPNVAQFWYFTVKPQMYMQFEAALKEHIAWHEKADDLASQPTGAAGGRIACGVVELGTMEGSEGEESGSENEGH